MRPAGAVCLDADRHAGLACRCLRPSDRPFACGEAISLCPSPSNAPSADYKRRGGDAEHLRTTLACVLTLCRYLHLPAKRCEIV